MQQRSESAAMNEEKDEQTSPLPSRGRQNSKLKVLVRSHAMREEASPPRQPSPHLISPSIMVIPSSESSPASLSPSPCLSPTSTLVPSPNSRRSPRKEDDDDDADGVDDDEQCCSSPKYLTRINHNGMKSQLQRDREHNTSHLNNNNKNRKICCDCSNQSCMKCGGHCQERNNNNNFTNVNNNNSPSSANTLSVQRATSKGKLRQQSSSQGSFDGSVSNSPCLSRDSSSEQYTDTSGIDLEKFIPDTLNRNAKDRAFMLRIEQELVSLAKDRLRSYYKFPPMSSYQRMLVHRCAAYFGMEHNIESSGKCVVVNKTKNTRIPGVEFKEHIQEEYSDEPRRSILKRDSNSVEDYHFKSPDDRHFGMENRRSKSFEEREEQYAKVRRRIFNCGMHDGGSSTDDFEWTEIPPWSSTDSDNSAKFNRLQPPEQATRRNGKLFKVVSEETGDILRPYVAKSHSFGGYGGVLNRGDSVVSTHSAGPRLLTKQDSGASSVSWRLSPSSSGYKSQSQMSESVTPSPTSTPHPITVDSLHDQEKDRIVWAVSDMHTVPKGSIIIDPQTGAPIKNTDGTLYHYDPNNPPHGFTVTAKPPQSPKKIAPPEPPPAPNSPKKRTSQYSPPHCDTKSHVNTATSPSLPYSSPNRAAFFAENMQMQAPQSQFPIYSQFAGQTPPDTLPPLYQPPCYVYAGSYAPFEAPPPALNELGQGAYYISDAGAPSISYQPPAASSQQAYWNQAPPVFYPPTGLGMCTPSPAPNNNQHAQHQQQQQRFPLSQNYVASFPHPPNFMQAPPAQAQQELVPVYPHSQSLQMVYQAPPPPPQNQPYPNLVYAQNPVFYPPQQQQQQNSYPQSTSTPNSCTSSLSHSFSGHHVVEQQTGVMQLAQSMSHLSFLHQQSQQNFKAGFDGRSKSGTPKSGVGGGGGGVGRPKGFFLGSSQSSTGTNSPAATVVAGYCPPNQGLYRTPPETPPAQYNYAPNFPIPPLLFRQMSNPRSNTPGTARSSRSPTPASDISHVERQRMSFPPNIYHSLSYVLPTDNRMIPGRSQANNYRQPPPPPPPVKQQTFYQQGTENRNHKTRKSKGNNKIHGLPPHGKSH